MNVLVAQAIPVGAILLITKCGECPVITPASLEASPASQDLGTIAVGMSSAAFTFTVTNTGNGGSSGSITTAIDGANRNDFKIGVDRCTGTTLPIAGSCVVAITFSPSASATEHATFTVTASPGTPATGVSSMLTGTGTGDDGCFPVISPSLEDFGSIAIGQVSQAALFTVTNAGNRPTGSVAASLMGTNAGQFVVTSNSCGAPLLPGSACTIEVEFAPTDAGSMTATLSVTTGGGAIAASLIGTGSYGDGGVDAGLPNDAGNKFDGG
jgi:hypothetical protein